nr:receptor-like protein kinase HSL1 [Coffea arabica]
MSETTQWSSQLTFLIFTIFFLSLPFLGNSQTTKTNPEEQTILLKLKQQWLNPPSLSHWTSSSDHCTWPEINCTGGSVTELNVSNLAITETIPSFICDLKNLTVLDLKNNFIPGSFPTVLYNCSKLEYLDLSQNLFVGTIPDDIDRLSPSTLQCLILEANNFTGDIPPAIGKLTGLKSLYAGTNLFNGSFPAEIGDLLNLEELALSFNGFVPQPIPSSFTRLKKLRFLWMFQTNLIGEIPQDIGNMTALESLNLADNDLSGNIPGGLFQLKNLSILSLYKNRLVGSIPSSIEALNLEQIDLSNNSLTGKIPDEFGKLTNLTLLALFFNELSGEVPTSLGMLPSLVDIKLFYNNLSGQLPPDFGRHSKLSSFQVSANNFTGNLPQDLCKNGVLLGVVAFGNSLTGELPPSLGNCDSMQVVQLQGNQFSGQIPDGLWTTNLTTLLIQNNSFTGQLPDKVAPGLSILDISNNQFSGEIPAGVSSWNNLREFKASNNLFSGKIPQELTSLPELGTLLLDGNRLSGSLPSSIISWKGLNVLSFSNNELSGQIPAAIGLLPVLNALDLSENDFSGQIPAQIGLLRLNSLNLSSNRLSGRIPGEFENAAFDRSFLGNAGLCSRNPSLGLNACASHTRESNKLSAKFVAAVSSIAAFGFLVALVYTFFLIRGYKKKKQGLDSTWKLTSFQKLNFTAPSLLSSLTESNMIGSGGSGNVYRVPINSSGAYVAVKKICNSKRLDHKEFLAEVEILGTIRHSNIVKLMCCISTDSSKLLVYEYMENRSLDRWLHCKRNRSANTGSIHHIVLEWPKRLQIAIDAARGLCYMHHDCSPSIIHRDLKSSNILLDSEFNAKIADFGLARMLVKDGEPNTMSVVAGSFGYIAPEYAQTRRVNEKVDVYSFGVILLELVTGREGNYGDETSSLAEWAWRHFQEGKPIIDAFDEDIMEPCYLDEIANVFKLGIFCTGLVPSNRPTMRDVLQILLRSVHSVPMGEKNGRSECDFAPLLNNSKREKSLIDEDGGFDSMV